MSWISDPIGTIKAMRENSNHGYSGPANPGQLPGGQQIGTQPITRPPMPNTQNQTMGYTTQNTGQQTNQSNGSWTDWLNTGMNIYNSLNGSGGNNNQQGMSDFEKMMLILNGVSGVAGGVGSFLEGKNYNDRMKEQLAENQRQFNESNALNKQQFAEGQRQFNIPQATDLSRSQDLAPLRDRATYMLSQRLGNQPGAFNPATLTQPGQQGGIDMKQMQTASNNYTPWAGGTKPGVDIRQKILQSLGYGG